MDFEETKEKYLKNLYKAEKDRSRKKSVDEAIKPLVNFINSLVDYYTTSSCSGRIYVISEPKSRKKYDYEWLFVSHEKVSFKEISTVLKKLPKESLWFRQEGAILHVCCRSLEAANKVLRISKEAGFKRSGMITTSNRIIVEILSTQKIALPIAKNKKMLVSEEYIKFVIKIANEKYDAGMKRLNTFYKLVRMLKK